MLSGDSVTRLARWIEAHVGPEHLQLIPERHPLRWWIPKLDAASLIEVLSGGGHLPLLAALILLGRERANDAPPEDAIRELVRGLLQMDVELVRASVGGESSKPDDVFICYAHEDAGHVDRICSVLRRSGLSVFRDTDRIRPGSSIAAAVAESAGRARTVVVVVSGASNSSRWVQRETAQAMARRSIASVEVYPVVIEEVPLPDTLSGVFAIDLRELQVNPDTVLLERRLIPLIDQIKAKAQG